MSRVRELLEEAYGHPIHKDGLYSLEPAIALFEPIVQAYIEAAEHIVSVAIEEVHDDNPSWN